METDQIAGKFKDVTGKAEAAVGKAAGSPDAELSGRERQVEGKAQDLYGKAQDVLGDVFGDTAKSADKAMKSARDVFESGSQTLAKEVNARPLIALIVAALVGYVVASVMHGSSRR